MPGEVPNVALVTASYVHSKRAAYSTVTQKSRCGWHNYWHFCQLPQNRETAKGGVLPSPYLNSLFRLCQTMFLMIATITLNPQILLKSPNFILPQISSCQILLLLQPSTTKTSLLSYFNSEYATILLRLTIRAVIHSPCLFFAAFQLHRPNRTENNQRSIKTCFFYFEGFDRDKKAWKFHSRVNLINTSVGVRKKWEGEGKGRRGLGEGWKIYKWKHLLADDKLGQTLIL